MSSRPAIGTPQREALTVPSFDGTPIVYDLYEGSSAGLVLLVPGFWRERRHPSMVRLAALLTAAGFRCAVMDLRGHGSSGGRFGFNRLEHNDVAAVATDALARIGTGGGVTLIGFSYGGAIAISAAARNPIPATGLLLVSPVAEFATLSPRVSLFTMHRHIAFTQALRPPRFEWRFARTSKLRAVEDVANVHAPVCFIHVKNDWLVDHTHSLALYERANEPKELHIIDIPGNYHADRIFSVAPEAIEPLVLGFVERTTRRT